MKKSKLRQIVREEIQRLKPKIRSGQITEASAGEEAKKRGLKSIGFGRYVDPADPSKVVAKSVKGKLVAVKKAEQPKGAKPVGKKPQPVPVSRAAEKPDRVKSRSVGNWVVRELPYNPGRGRTKAYEKLFWVGKKDNSRGNQFFMDKDGKILDLQMKKLPNKVQNIVNDFIKDAQSKVKKPQPVPGFRAARALKMQQALKDVIRKAEDYEGEFAGGDAKSGFVFLFPDKDTAEGFVGAETAFGEREKAPKMWPVKHKGQTGFAVKILGKNMQPTVDPIAEAQTSPYESTVYDREDFFEYTPPLIADRRFYLQVREGKLPELDWEL